MRVKVCSFIIPWFHFFLLQLCVQRLGSLLPVKIPILSSVLVLQVNSSILYQTFLLYQNKRLNFDEELQGGTWRNGKGSAQSPPPTPAGAAGTWCRPLPSTAWHGARAGRQAKEPALVLMHAAATLKLL
uniref:Uncharacterized protein n=1 Tax=Chelonoidis abingdonii TaxID=106734 RepID=A0A8C0HIP5_CHEAB